MNSHHNWDHYDHQTLYDRIHGNGGFFLPDGAGVSGASGAQEGWGELATLMGRARDRTEAALNKAGAVWEGGASDAMRSGVSPLAQWAEDAQAASVASQSSIDLHVSAYSTAKNQMPEPVRVASTANGDYGGVPALFTHMLGGQTDQDKQEAAAQEAKAEAVRTMARYDTESATSRVTLGQFVPPSSFTVDVPPAQPKRGDVIPVGVTEWPGTGQVDDGGQPTGHTPGPGGTPGDPRGTGSTPPPEPGQTTTRYGSTTPSVFTPTPTSVSPTTANPVPTGLGSDPYRSTPPVPLGTGTLGGPGGTGTPGGRGFGGGATPGGRGAGPGAGGVRGSAPGAGALANESVAGRPGTVGARGAAGTGMAPVGGRSNGDEDKEHKPAEYLRGSHDDFWDDTPPVAPSVIGDEDDE